MSMGDALTQATIKILEQRSQAMDSIAQIIARILQNLSDRAEFTKEGNEGIKALLKHLEKGKNVDSTAIAKEDVELVDEILRSSQMPYVMAYDSKEGHCILMTRDSDRDVLKDVLEQYAIKKGTELQEIEINDFLNAYEGKGIRIEKGLDAATIELFREKAKQYNCTYAVVESKTNPEKFELLYPREKEKACDDALKDVAYDFVGEEGRAFKNKVSENIRKREDFKKNLRPKGEETVFICSKKDPTKFLAITKDGFSVHDIQTMREKFRDGGENVRLTDKNTAVFNSFNKEKLGNYIDQIKEPVLLSAEEFGIVKGVSVSGKASFIKDEDFKSKYQQLLETLSGKEISYPSRLVEELNNKKEKVVSYENLFGSQIDEIEDRLIGTGLEKYLVQGQDEDHLSIAFPERLKDRIAPTVEDVLYGSSVGVDRMQRELMYQGRGTLDIHRAEDVVMDASMPGVALFFDRDYMSIVQRPDEEERAAGKKNIPLEKIYRNDPDYDKKVSGIIKSMKEVVIFDKDEYRKTGSSDAALAKMIRARVPSEHKSEATKEYERYIDEHKKSVYDALHRQNNDVDHMEELSERQQEAIHSHYNRGYEDIYVNRSAFEKLSTLDFAEKKYSRTDVYEYQQTSVVR